MQKGAHWSSVDDGEVVGGLMGEKPVTFLRASFFGFFMSNNEMVFASVSSSAAALLRATINRIRQSGVVLHGGNRLCQKLLYLHHSSSCDLFTL